MFIQITETWAADCRGNCHWFAFGRPIRSEELGRELREHYVRSHYAQPGDIVIYRDAAGYIRHSGRVVANGLVRSKCGNSPLVLHSVEACPYESDRVEFYRAKR